MQESILPLSERMVTGASVQLQGVGGFVNAPFQVVNLESELVSGLVTVSLQSTLPMEGVSFIIRNDLISGRVSINPQMVEEPSVESNTEQLEKLIPDLFSSCKVTRSRSRKRCEEKGVKKDVDLEPVYTLEKNVYEPGQ